MEFVIIYNLTLVFFVVYSLLEGIREAYYYHSAVRSGDVEKFNLHNLFWVQRLIVSISMLCIYSFFLKNILVIVSVLLSQMLIFSFFHNGAYYCTRNNLDSTKYPRRFKDNSRTSNAILEFSYIERLFYFIIGFIIHLITLFIYLKLI